MNELDQNPDVPPDLAFDGSLPTIDTLWERTAENQENLRKRYKELQSWSDNIAGEIRYSRVGAKIGVSEQFFGRFVRGDAELDQKQYKALLTLLWDNKLWSDSWRSRGPAAKPGTLFIALSEFLDVGEISKERLVTETPGLYRSWRPSMHVPGAYVLGMLQIIYEDDKDIVRVIEKQRFRGSDRESPQFEQHEGILVKKSNCYIIIARQFEVNKTLPRITVVSNCLYEKNCARTMQGLTIGSYGNSLFAAPAYFERIDPALEASLLEEMDIVDQVPPSVLGKMKFSVVDNVMGF